MACYLISCDLRAPGRNFDLKAVHLNAKMEEDMRTTAELMDLIEQKGKEISQCLAVLKR